MMVGVDIDYWYYRDEKIVSDVIMGMDDVCVCWGDGEGIR